MKLIKFADLNAVSDRILAVTVLRILPSYITPNQITILRFFCIPFVLFLLFAGYSVFGMILFMVAAFTDALDGALARTSNQITDWGKIYDPMADKLLIVSTALVIIPQYLGYFIVLAIMLVEMLLIGAAYYFKNNSSVDIMANGWGKMKMITQSLGVILMLVNSIVHIPLLLTTALIILMISIVLGIISLVTYSI